MLKKLPDFSYEKKIWRKGYSIIAGIDEVGRGAFAGPVVAGAVIFKENTTINVLVNDSKKLSQKQREIADIWIRENCISYGIGSASVTEINKLGIKKATEIAFRKAVKNCNYKVNYLLIDAFYIPFVKGLRKKNQKPIIKGDAKSLSIAAASIVAKVYRDAYMATLATNPKYKKYKWHENKGYGTKNHRDAIGKYGPTKLHRYDFIKKLLEA